MLASVGEKQTQETWASAAPRISSPTQLTPHLQDDPRNPKCLQKPRRRSDQHGLTSTNTPAERNDAIAGW